MRGNAKRKKAQVRAGYEGAGTRAQISAKCGKARALSFKGKSKVKGRKSNAPKRGHAEPKRYRGAWWTVDGCFWMAGAIGRASAGTHARVYIAKRGNGLAADSTQDGAATCWAFVHGIHHVGNVANCEWWATTWISMALAQTRINGLTNCKQWATTQISMAFARTRIDGLGLMRACTGCTRGWIGAMREVCRMYERVRTMYERVEV
ncbi:hypothetical protein EV424DRAFT_1344472 [Suillus variegatus]|nr:hypothetical protein EV424DRAFT_1344472 [Suillus variegatus]